MNKKILLGLGVAGLIASMAAADVLSFTNSTFTLNSSSDALVLNNNTADNTVSSGSGDSVNFMSNIAIQDTGNSVDDDFTLTLNAGFGFNPAAGSETWDTTDSTDLTRNTHRIFAGRGIGPRGDNGNPKFADGEILWFEVTGLDAGNSLKLNGFTMWDDSGNESGFLSYYTGDSGTITLGGTVGDGGVTTFGSALSLGNGDRFGIAFTDAGSTANRSYLESLNIEVVPEPATLGMITALGGGMLFIRRRFMM